jgi:16S rRNA (adenine1518-N6/adenine1519-N6)-dimethyltransferase
VKQASLRRLKEFGIRPNRELGQNFLIDDNILRLVGDAAELDKTDVVLEVGGGVGVLTEHLAPRVGHLHVVEIDSRLEAALSDALAPFGNTTLHLADALTLDYASLDPLPGKVVANLPYGIAATVLLKAVADLPGATMFVAMVQREVGERLAAGPGTKTYGATSVIAQLSCDVKVVRRVPATVFHPAPNVESALVSLRRREAPPERRVVNLVHGGFAHRRKALARSLSITGHAGRDAVRTALEEMGHPADERAERLQPREWRDLAERLG